MRRPLIIAARRTAVAPRDGAFKQVEARDLAAAAIRALVTEARIDPVRIDEVILGNALYGGGNPARMASLAAGLPETLPALTVDTQCCAGLDAIMLAGERIAAAEAEAIIAGGVESFSRAPLRLTRPRSAGEEPVPYDRPPFTPWPDRDPDLIEAAASLAAQLGISRGRQEAFAAESHRKALARPPTGEIVSVAGTDRDVFGRLLTPELCRRLPLLAGDAAHGLSAATVAVAADAAAVVLVVSEALAERLALGGQPLRILGGRRMGGDPEHPSLAPIGAARALLARHGLAAADLAVSEVMEAFAPQAIACIEGLGLDEACVNRGGGALARGHPIGASGAILAVRLWHELQSEPEGAAGLAAIAGAGGLGSALLVSR